MHSRIFELKSNKTDENQLTESSISCETMVFYGIDYVSEMNASDSKESIEWLKAVYAGAIDVDTESGLFHVTDPKKCMEADFKTFKDSLAKLNNMTIDDFVKTSMENFGESIGYNMYCLNNAYADKSGFYIYMDDRIRPINEFIRDVSGDITKYTFYLGNVLDYHC